MWPRPEQQQGPVWLELVQPEPGQPELVPPELVLQELVPPRPEPKLAAPRPAVRTL